MNRYDELVDWVRRFAADEAPRRRAATRRARLLSWGRELVVWGLFLALPFGVFSWMTPFRSRLTIGNDYQNFPIGAQIDLMWSIKHGTWPLYMPGFAVGHSTAAMTLGQLFHPISWLSAHMPGYWDGKELEYNTAYRILSLGVAHLALYRVCRRLKMQRVAAILATFPAVYNLRMLDSLRYGASLEGYSGMLMISAAAAFVYLEPDSLKPVALLSLSAYMTAVCGHPQWAYLALFAASIFAALVPWITRAISGEGPKPDARGLFQYAKRIALGLGSGALFAAPYVLPFYFEYLKNNHARAENSYRWTLGYVDTLPGEINNFLMPFHADVHGAFGGTVLFLIAALFPLLALARHWPPKVLWVLYALLFIAFSFAAGSQGFGGGKIHRFIVEHVPGFNVFRAPGRIVIWIPAFVWPLWAWLLQPRNRRSLFLLALGALLVWASRWFWSVGLPTGAEYTTPHKIQAPSVLPASYDVKWLYWAGASLGAITLVGGFRRPRWVTLPLAAGLVFVTSWMAIRYGTWVQKKDPMPTAAIMEANRQQSVASHIDPGEGMELRGVTDYRAHRIGLGRPLATIERNVTQVDSEAQLWPALASGRTDRIFLDTPPVTLATETSGDADEIKLRYNTCNRHDFDVVAARDGYVVLGLPLIQGFEATVDGAAVPVAKANGLFTAFPITRGKHEVQVRFVSRPFLAGAAIAFLTAWAWLFVVLRPRLTGRVRVLGLAAMFALSTVAFAWALHRGIDGGRSLGTRYAWRSPLAAAPVAPTPR